MAVQSVYTFTEASPGSTLNVRAPSGVQLGDILLCFIGTDYQGQGLHAGSTGFTRHYAGNFPGSVTTYPHHTYLYWKIAVASDVTTSQNNQTYNFTTGSGAARREAIIIRIDNPINYTTNPILGSTVPETGNLLSPNPPSVTGLDAAKTYTIFGFVHSENGTSLTHGNGVNPSPGTTNPGYTPPTGYSHVASARTTTSPAWYRGSITAFAKEGETGSTSYDPSPMTNPVADHFLSITIAIEEGLSAIVNATTIAATTTVPSVTTTTGTGVVVSPASVTATTFIPWVPVEIYAATPIAAVATFPAVALLLDIRVNCSVIATAATFPILTIIAGTATPTAIRGVSSVPSVNLIQRVVLPTENTVSPVDVSYYVDDPARRLARFYPPRARGRNVFMLTDGSITNQQPADDSFISRVLYGGHEGPNDLTSAEVAALIAAGYSMEVKGKVEVGGHA